MKQSALECGYVIQSSAICEPLVALTFAVFVTADGELVVTE